MLIPKVRGSGRILEPGRLSVIAAVVEFQEHLTA